MPKLRVLAGPTPHDLTPITSLVNTNTAHQITNDAWKGEIVVFIKGFNQADPSLRDSPEAEQYFSKREDVTWSIQVRGRFLSPRSADEVLFGNIFERPLKLPWGTGAALKFMKLIDPTLSHDLTCTAAQKPWALSPLLATMPYLSHTRLPSPDSPSRCDTAHPLFPSPTPITEDTSSLHLSAQLPLVEASRSRTPSSIGSSDSRFSRSSGSSGSSRWSLDSKKNKKRKAADGEVPRAMTSQQRRSYFSSEGHRKAVSLGPQDVITTDFCYGFLEFAPSLRLRLPGGLGLDLARYWDGQPVCFVCCLPGGRNTAYDSECSDAAAYNNNKEHDGVGNVDNPWGRVFWCVSIEMDSDEDEDEPVAG